MFAYILQRRMNGCSSQSNSLAVLLSKCFFFINIILLSISKLCLLFLKRVVMWLFLIKWNPPTLSLSIFLFLKALTSSLTLILMFCLKGCNNRKKQKFEICKLFSFSFYLLDRKFICINFTSTIFLLLQYYYFLCNYVRKSW